MRNLTKINEMLKLINKLNNCGYIEASQFDRINMTEKRLEFDRKKITPTNLTDGS